MSEDKDKSMENSTKKSSKKKKRKVWKIILITILIIFLSCTVIGGAAVLAMVKTAPKLDLDLITSLDKPTTFYDDKGNLMDTYLTAEKRDPASIDEVPDNLKNAFIAIEDERFYKHKGIDFVRLAGASLSNAKNIFTGGELQGASTITQQLIKQVYFLEDSLNDRFSIKRKVQEMYLAMQLERKVSKEQILESYMNTIYLGGNSYGIKAAAKQYFNKDLKDLTLTECAFIAGSAQSPSVSYSAAHYAFENNEVHESPRTSAVLSNMLRLGYISQEQYDEATKPQLTYSFDKHVVNKMNFEWFSRPVIESVRKDLMEKYNYDDKEVNALLANGGLKVYTTMDNELQKTAQAVINDELTTDNPYSSYILPRDGNGNLLQPDIQASCTIMDYHNGDVKVIIGGRGEQDPLSYNRAASENFLRAPGSAIKPLTVYAPAIDSKRATAGTVFDDTPIPQSIGSKYAGPGEPPYNPSNASKDYSGYTTVRDSLRRSLNVIAVKLLDSIGLDLGASYGEKFGLELDDVDKSSMAALALGQTDSGEYAGTNPLTMSAAYGVFGNQGKLTEPRLYTKVEDSNGKVILEKKTTTKDVLDPAASYVMWDLLKAPVGPGGTAPSAVFDSSVEVRGKTGTSTDSSNLWFCGLTPNYSGAVWIGNDDYTPVKGSINSDTMGKLWARVMSEVHKNVQTKEVAMPSNITWADISKDSGTLPSDLTFKDPRGNRVYSEIFINGTVPSAIDNVHVLAKVVKKGDRYVLATDNSDPSLVEERVFITRPYAVNVPVRDAAYILPTEKDDTVYKPKEEEDKDKDKDKDKVDQEKPGNNTDTNKPNNGDANKPPTDNGTTPVPPTGGNNNGNTGNQGTPGTNDKPSNNNNDNQ